jgi:hypothetical protein
MDEDELDELEAKMSKVLDRLDKTIQKIKEENGMPDYKGIVCLRCRKIVQSEDGLLYCDCTDERTGIDVNDPDVVVINPEDIIED